jgi:hypothetical protein
VEHQSSTTSAFGAAEDKEGNAEVLTPSYLDCLGGGLCPFHLQGSGARPWNAERELSDEIKRIPTIKTKVA